MARVIVSAGHTNNDPGTVINGLREVDLNRAIAKKIVAQLRANGIITLSVPPNMDLQRRIDWINGTGYKAEFEDIAIEIHVNDGNKSGFEFWYTGEGNNSSQKLAQTVMQNVTKRTGLASQGVKSEFDHEFKSLAFLNKTNTISILLECLYIDNKEDQQKLKDEAELDKIAKGIAEGICKHLNIEYIETESPKTSTISQPKPQPVIQKQNTQINSLTTNQHPVSNTSQAPAYNPAPYQYQNMNTMPYQSAQPTNSYNNYDSYNSATSYAPAQPPVQPQMSREERKNMIIDLYKRILGREPNQNDLNYFLNIGITEDNLIKRMIESQEHLDLVNSKTDYELNKEIYEKQKVELSRLKAENNDQKILLNNLSKLLHQKNRYISEMKARLDKIDPDSAIRKETQAQSESKPKYQGKLSDRFFHFLSSFLG